MDGIAAGDKEKHFWVTNLVKDGQEAIIACILEAVINRHEYQMTGVYWRTRQFGNLDGINKKTKCSSHKHYQCRWRRYI